MMSHININAILNRRCAKMDEIVTSLNDPQILDACDCASRHVVERMRSLSERFAEAVDQIESIQDGR